MMQFLYNVLATILVVLAIPVFIVRTVREEAFGERLRQSFGLLPPDVLARVAGKGCIWLHAASVGEIVATSPIVKEIRRRMPEHPILISVVTSSGYAMAQRIIPDADGLIYFPVDLPWLSHSVVARIKPRVFLPVETELWPNFLRNMRKYNIPVMMVNGRISDKSLHQYRYLGNVLQHMLDTVTKFCMQSAIDAEYIIHLGADPNRVVITGNTKFDQTYTEVGAEEKAQLMNLFGFDGTSPVIIAGSTHKGEEEILLAALTSLRTKFPSVRVIVAPRDILRADEVKELATASGFTAIKRTALTAESNDSDIIILDTIGELGRIYSLGDIIFVGGSLVPLGGHNILEPAAHGKPILVGPHMFNFKDTYALLSGRGACATVHDAAGLAAKMLEILEQPEVRQQMSAEALAIIRENGGAARKSALYLQELLRIHHVHTEI